MQIALGLAVTVVTFLLVAAMRFIALNPPAFLAARMCVALSSLTVIVMTAVWQFNSSKIASEKWVTAFPIYAACVSFGYVFWAFISHREKTYNTELSKKNALTELKNTLKRLLAEAGELAILADSPENERLASIWITSTYSLILDKCGVGEADLFMSDADYTFIAAITKDRRPANPRNEIMLQGRIRRLKEIIDRL